ncbi:toxin-antitoxin system YwqK family antitoxin [Myroides sp. WP-1]|uniref:toxin-antitoxin system YwqK family antitoxin n=1 Tax=Myroides sp. WP-1 TaxID=2759944 RepID=UPI0015FE3EE5|nr:hypothetical protein [Myroides sp. WP-1]MBB1137951.1 hypothetical protein [Myroides sp. WP-1]
MKQFLLYFTLLVFGAPTIYAQKLTLNDLATLCNKRNWEEVNQALLNRKWTYYDSEKGSAYNYNTIAWSYNKDYYSDKAEAWLYLYTDEGYPNKISYSIFNKESYSVIQNSISSAGYKLINSEIENNQIISTYANSNFTLQVSTEKRKDEDWLDRSLTAYKIILIKKGGAYDNDNGKKRDYYADGTLQSEYILAHGKLNGNFKVYYENGNLKKSGNFNNGIENGLIKEYDEEGNLEAETTMINGKKNGALKIYNQDKLSYVSTYKNDIQNGTYSSYSYSPETGSLQLKLTGEFLNDEKNGAWKLLFFEENKKERVLKLEHYTHGIKNGSFQDIQGDSLIIGEYKNDKLHGAYKIYLDVNRMLLGGVIRTDTLQLTLMSQGNYLNGEKYGKWKTYDITKALRSEGMYNHDLQTGEWKYYYTKYSDANGVAKPYSNELYLKANFVNGELDGKSVRYSYLNQEKTPCDEEGEDTDLEDCSRYVYQKVLENSTFKQGKLDGLFEVKDSLNQMMAKGLFKNDLKEGEWLHRYVDHDEYGTPYFTYEKGNYEKGLKEGKWIQYQVEGKVDKTFNYKNDQLHGDLWIWNANNKPIEKMLFNHGDLTELITYDKLSSTIRNKYEIYNLKSDSYKCKKTEYYDNNTYASQEYRVTIENEINPYSFEYNFILSTRDNSNETGYKDGQFVLYNSKNNPEIIGDFFKKNKTGNWTYYYYDQEVKIEANYDDNILKDEKYLTLNGSLYSGNFVFQEKGNDLKEERKIKDGVRHGRTVYLDTKTNTIIKKENYKNGVLK